MAGRLTSDEQDKYGVDSYYERATTKTKANKTLFIAFRDATVQIEKEERASRCEQLFSDCNGYIGTRQRKGVCFVDFVDIKSATAAMMRHQHADGLTIDYDKDTGVAQKRSLATEEVTQRNQREAQSASYFCVSCGTKAFKTSAMMLSAMPARSTGDRVVDEDKNLEQYFLEPIASAQPFLIKREKGTERQYRQGCRSCDAVIAYRSVPMRTSGKFLYVDPKAVSETSTSAAVRLKSEG